MLDKYLDNPKDWDDEFTGICKVKIDGNHGDYITRCVRGTCWGPFVVLNHDKDA